MRDLWFYDRMAKVGFLTYRAKILLMATIGTQVPLATLAAHLALRSQADDLIVVLAASLAAGLIVLLVLHHLLRPIALAARTLGTYRQTRDIGSLPTHYTDEAGRLMADATAMLLHLERAMDVLEDVDATTRLPNRKTLALDLARRMHASARFAACAVRVGAYDGLHEALGLPAAEAAAADIAARLRAALRDDETLYRIAGSDFIVLTQGPRGAPAVPEDIGERLHDLIAAAARDVSGVEPLLSAAVALFPQDAQAPETLIDHAVGALALANAEMRVSFYSPATRQAAVERRWLERDLRRALAHDEFVLHYQPVIDLALGRVVGAEALIRWQHPVHGLLPPGRFIGAAEACGLMDPVGLWVLRRACLQVGDWNESGLPGLKIAVNLTAPQFLDPNLLSFVREALRTSGIAPDQLEIELTETAAMADHDHTRAVFGRLRDLGVTTAIDDFGTGYASLSYLRKLPFDKLKIDREFVMGVHRAPDSQAICTALVALARGLGLRALAEGTESEEEVRFLHAQGCELYQGYCFSRPLPAGDFRATLRYISRNVAEMADRLTPPTGLALAT
jgi:EAL domain-containing protein (putative c-di-GMP-specific phosphodiesterase class I)/GGDEF domain-containing protein